MLAGSVLAVPSGQVLPAVAGLTVAALLPTMQARAQTSARDGFDGDDGGDGGGGGAGGAGSVGNGGDGGAGGTESDGAAGENGAGSPVTPAGNSFTNAGGGVAGAGGGGGYGGSAATGGGGGGGGSVGFLITFGGTVFGDITGGAGGDGGAGSTGGSADGGGGGGGGNGFVIRVAQPETLAIGADVQAGAGGAGGAGNGPGALGGDGGDGGNALLVENDGHVVIITGTMTGGDGGGGGIGPGRGGSGGDGGHGILVQGTGVTLRINGDVEGGTGGLHGGVGGQGIRGAGLTIELGARTAGGLSSLGARQLSLALTGGTNRLVLLNGWDLVGGVGISASASLDIENGIDADLDQVISGQGSLIKSGDGVLVLGAANSFEGGTTIREGVLSVSDDGNLGDASGTLTLDGGTLRVTGVGFGSSARAFEFASSGVIEVVDPGHSLELTGDITGGGGFTKLGAGTLELSGTNTYAGTTRVVEGTILSQTGAAIPVDTIVILDEGALVRLENDDFEFVGLEGGGRFEAAGAANAITLFTTVPAGHDFAGDLEVEGGVNFGGEGTTQRLSGDAYFGAGLSVLGDADYVLEISGGDAVLGNGSGSVDAFDIFSGTMRLVDAGTLTSMDPDALLSVVSLPSGGTEIPGKFIVDGAGSSLDFAGSAEIAGEEGTLLEARNGGEATFGGDITLTAGELGAMSGARIRADGDIHLDGGVARVDGAGSEIFAGGAIGVDCACAPAELIVTNGGAAVSTGTLYVSGDGTLRIGTGDAAGTVDAPEIENDGHIVADFTDEATLDMPVSGSGMLTKTGTGTLILTEDSTYGGATEVNGGALVVNGSIASSSLLTVGPDGRVGGTGSLPELRVEGVLAPGNSIGTITVNGALTFAPGSVYAVEVSPDAADRTNVRAIGGSGEANLSGATVQATYEGGDYIRRRYVIVNAEGGLGGTEFADLEGAPPTGTDHALDYDQDSAYLVLTLDMDVEEPDTEKPGPDDPGGPETDPPGTDEPGTEDPGDDGAGGGGPDFTRLDRNSRAVADAIVAFFNAGGALPVEFAALTPRGLSLASAETATGAMQAGLAASQAFMGQIADPLLGARERLAPVAPIGYADDPALATAAAFERRWQAWGSVYGTELERDGDAVVGSHDLSGDVYGIASGFVADNGQTRAGIALGGSWSDYGLAGGLGGGEAGTFSVGLHARHDFGGVYLAGAAAYGLHDVSTRRAVGGETLEGDFTAHSFSGRAEAGYRFETPVGMIAPFAALQATSFRMPAYGETASGRGLFALDVDDATVTDRHVDLGVRVAHSLDVGGVDLTLRGMAAWRHDFGSDRAVKAGFQALPGTSFETVGASPARNAAIVSAGAELAWDSGLAAAVSFDGAFSGKGRSLGGRARLSYSW